MAGKIRRYLFALVGTGFLGYALNDLGFFEYAGERLGLRKPAAIEEPAGAEPGYTGPTELPPVDTIEDLHVRSVADMARQYREDTLRMRNDSISGMESDLTNFEARYDGKVREGTKTRLEESRKRMREVLGEARKQAKPKE